MSYLAACNGDCTTVDKTILKRFKIAEMGQLTYGTGGGKAGTWADDKLRAVGGAWSVKIPASIKAGTYTRSLRCIRRTMLVPRNFIHSVRI
jgi:cellulase